MNTEQVTTVQANGKIALVTGGSRGLGKDMALRLAENGVKIVLTYREQQESAIAVVAEIQSAGGAAVALPLDVGNVASFDKFLESVQTTIRNEWGAEKFNFLINNAGHGGGMLIEQATEEFFDTMLNVHFKGVYFLTQKSLPHIADGGRIINVSSGTTRFCNPGYSIYASMKGAVEVFTRYLAKEVGVRGITANVIAPGAIETDFNNAAVRSNPQAKAYIASQTALGRVGIAEDIGGVVAFLCSEDGRWISGQRLEISGGVFL
jgi:NAD(P)-dependent dehydrogenase (short-subunit alcohol dehydrogenase family)